MSSNPTSIAHVIVQKRNTEIPPPCYALQFIAKRRAQQCKLVLAVAAIQQNISVRGPLLVYFRLPVLSLMRAVALCVCCSGPLLALHVARVLAFMRAVTRGVALI